MERGVKGADVRGENGGGEEQRQEKERGGGEEGERQKANSEGRVVLILVDRNFRKSDRGRSKVTRWLQFYLTSLCLGP